MKSKKIIIFFIILITAIILRFYKLDTIPSGLYQDETAIAYNAQSIKDTGKDEHGRYFPFYFESFGDQKLPMYIYTTVISQILFGVNAFSTRFPSAFFGVLSIIIFFFFVKKTTANTNLAYISMTLLTFNPWHIHYSRATFEVSIVLFFILAGIYCLLLFVEKPKQIFFLLSVVCFISAAYSYNLTRILSPLIFTGFLFIERKNITSEHKKSMIVGSILGVILLIPFLTTFFTNGGFQSAKGTLITSSAAVQAPLLEFRSYFVQYPLLNRILFNFFTLTGWQYIKNITQYFSVPFFFISGSTHGNHGISTHGQFHLFELPLMVLGFFYCIKKYKKYLNIYLLPIILTILVAALTRESPHATRSYTLLTSLPIFSAMGILFIYEKIRKQKEIIQLFTGCLFTIVTLFFVISYLSSYFIRFPIVYAAQWRYEDKDISLFLKEIYPSVDSILIDKHAGLIYSSILYYTNFSPKEFQRTVQREPPDSEGFTEVISFGKYIYKDIDWNNDIKKKNVIIITSPENKPKSIEPTKVFNFPQRPVVVALKQEIVQFPITDTAYVLIKNNQ